MSDSPGSLQPCPLVVVWEFRVRPGRRRAFERAYGPGGEWVRWFAHNPGHLRGALIRDQERPLRYLTLDVWRSRGAYLRFMRQNRAPYARIDKRRSWLTVKEKLLGEWEMLAPLTPTNSASAHLEIRPATRADIPGMVALEREIETAAHWSDSAYQRIFHENFPTRLALALHGQDRTIAGFIVASLSGQDCELENIVVARPIRSAGWGRRLLTEMMAWARSRNAREMFLEVRESASRARGLYERCGFRPVGRRHLYYRDPVEDAILYRLDL